MNWLEDCIESSSKQLSDKVMRSSSELKLLTLHPDKPFVNILREPSSGGLYFKYNSVSIIFKLSKDTGKHFFLTETKMTWGLSNFTFAPDNNQYYSFNSSN